MFTPSPRLQPRVPRSIRAYHCRVLVRSSCFFFYIAFQLRVSLFLLDFGSQKRFKWIKNLPKIDQPCESCFDFVFNSFWIPFLSNNQTLETSKSLNKNGLCSFFVHSAVSKLCKCGYNYFSLLDLFCHQQKLEIESRSYTNRLPCINFCFD